MSKDDDSIDDSMDEMGDDSMDDTPNSSLDGLRPFDAEFITSRTIWARSQRHAEVAADKLTEGMDAEEELEGRAYRVTPEIKVEAVHEFDTIALESDTAEGDPDDVTLVSGFDLSAEQRAEVTERARALAAEPAHSEPHETAPTWAVGDRVTVFDLSDDDVDGALGFVGVGCEVVSLPDPEDPDSMVRVRHANGLLGDFWPEELAAPGTPPTKRVARAIAEGYGHRRVSLAEAFDRVQLWQRRTFGESSPVQARGAKLVDEAHEVVAEVAAGDDADVDRVMAEVADVCFLVADIIRKYNRGPEQLANAIMGNLAKNERDQWAADATGKFSRVKAATETPK